MFRSEAMTDLNERAECSVCRHWPMRKNWANHIVAYPTHWPAALAAEAAPLDVDDAPWQKTGDAEYDLTPYAGVPVSEVLAAAEAAPLDVERLARAIVNVIEGDDTPLRQTDRAEAADIAREYAALRSPDTETAERP